MINALDLNCEIIALDTIFNREMLKQKEVIFFKKNIESIESSIIKFEKKINFLKKINKDYTLPNNYLWETVTNKYIGLFEKSVQPKVS